MVVFILIIVGLAAAVTWLVVRLSPPSRDAGDSRS
jgi:hypothetical protein